MKTALSSLDLRRAASLADALAILRTEHQVPIAGATDLYVGLNFGTVRALRFLDLWPLDELRAIAVEHDRLVMGALVTYTQMIASADVRERLPMLIEAARQVGGPQIQNRGTIGGNIANGSPAGDSLPVLAAADAVVVLRSVDAERRVPFMSFYTGYRASVMRADELIVAVEVPRVEGAQWFRKVGRGRPRRSRRLSWRRFVRRRRASPSAAWRPRWCGLARQSGRWRPTHRSTTR